MYQIAEFTQDKYRFRLYDNVKRLTWQQIQSEQGCAGILNLAYFSLATYAHQSAIMIGGTWVHSPIWHAYGVCIDKAGYLTAGTEAEAVYDYAIGCPAVLVNGRRQSNEIYAKNGVTYTGIKADGTVVALLASKDDGLSSAQAEEILLGKGCVTVLRWDGSWSSQGTLGPGKDVQPSQSRICRSWLLIFEKEKEDKPVKKTVCLDPGHGPDTVNGSPDGSYKEQEFAWDLYQRLTPLLEAQGVNVICTRTEDTKPSLTERATVANNAKADCFVSLHTNASGSGWSDAHGLEIYTSSGPDTAQRNVLAQDILDEMEAAGVELRSSPLVHNISLTVLAKTNMPAVLIEFGFHSNKEDVALLLSDAYRDKLAEATARGVCDWLGIQYKGKEETTVEKTWYADAQEWAVEMGIADGTRPLDTCTRAEMWTMLQRLYNLIKGGK